MKMKQIITILCITSYLLLNVKNQGIVNTVDFLTNTVISNSTLGVAFISMSLDLPTILPVLNSTNFKSLILNSNIYGDFSNNWNPKIKFPLGYKYNCTVYGALNANVTCTLSMKANLSIITLLGAYNFESALQPYSTLGWDYQYANYSDTDYKNSWVEFINKTYTAHKNVLSTIQVVDFGDKAVSLGYKVGSYNITNFTDQIGLLRFLVNGPRYIGPGITQDADSSWLLGLTNFSQQVPVTSGHFTVRCIPFRNGTVPTIDLLLSQNYTSSYFKRRFTVNANVSYTNFKTTPLGITDIRMMDGVGIDGVTNTFAAALWLIDVALQFGLMSGLYIAFWNPMTSGNFQNIFGPPPSFQPTALYYGMIFLSLIKNGNPKIIVPFSNLGLSSKIKVWGLQTDFILKLVLINKDTNTSLNGISYVRMGTGNPATCTYFTAPNLSSKTGLTIGGYQYLANNPNPVGNYTTITINVDQDGYYSIPLSYAQAVVCESSIAQNSFPVGPKYGFHLSFITILVIIMISCI